MNIVNKDIEIYKVGDIVNLPLDEVGLIEAIEPGIMEYNYCCKIIMATISDVGGIGLYHESDLNHLDFRSTKAKKLLVYATKLITYFDRQVQESQKTEVNIDHLLRDTRINISNLNTQLKFFKSSNFGRNKIYDRIDRNLKIERTEMKRLLRQKFQLK